MGELVNKLELKYKTKKAKYRKMSELVHKRQKWRRRSGFDLFAAPFMREPPKRQRKITAR